MAPAAAREDALKGFKGLGFRALNPKPETLNPGGLNQQFSGWGFLRLMDKILHDP